VTKGIENWPLSTSPLSAGASSHENHIEYLHDSHVSRIQSPWQTFLLMTVWEYLHLFSHSCLCKRGKNLVKLVLKTDFDTKQHFRVIQVAYLRVVWKRNKALHDDV